MCTQKWAQANLKMLSTKCVYKSYIHLIYIYKKDLVLNNLQGLICYKTQPNPNNYNTLLVSTQSAGAVEYDDCISVKE